jgi:hypothetical protein
MSPRWPIEYCELTNSALQCVNKPEYRIKALWLGVRGKLVPDCHYRYRLCFKCVAYRHPNLRCSTRKIRRIAITKKGSASSLDHQARCRRPLDLKKMVVAALRQPNNNGRQNDSTTNSRCSIMSQFAKLAPERLRYCARTTSIASSLSNIRKFCPTRGLQSTILYFPSLASSLQSISVIPE